MRLAKSILLGELVAASAVEHADTAGFQIVCPCCDESVFKVARPLKGGSTSEFFSHRQNKQHQIEICEMRVSSLTIDAIYKINAEARGQSLDIFNSHLRSALSLRQYVYGKAKPGDVHRRISSMPMYRDVFERVRRYQLSYGVEGVMAEFRSSKNKLPPNSLSGTTFGESVQERITRDMVGNLLTSQGKSNLEWLFRHTLNRLSHDPEGIYANFRPYRCFESAAMTKNPRIAKIYFNQGVEIERITKRDYFAETITSNMMIDLVMLPYAEMLANHRAGREPLTGIKPTSVLLKDIEELDPSYGPRP